MQSLGLHTHSGGYFCREGSGDVVFRRTRPVLTLSGTPTGEVCIVDEMRWDASSWASIVSFVSVNGENAATFESALAFHQGVTREMIPSDNSEASSPVE